AAATQFALRDPPQLVVKRGEQLVLRFVAEVLECHLGACLITACRPAGIVSTVCVCPLPPSNGRDLPIHWFDPLQQLKIAGITTLEWGMRKSRALFEYVRTLVGVTWLALSVPLAQAEEAAKPATAKPFDDLIANNCAKCHNATDWAGSLAF